ncbi:hypothetical protein GOBAR_DD27417 [Gossypium barbadense]|nr:hypothetical protein GOBAR_DD27417 [Gossypium barbadense]
MEDALENLRLLDDEEEALQEHDGALVCLGHGESYCPLRLSIDPSKLVFGWDLSIRAVARNRSRVASRWLRAADGSPCNDENWAGFTQGNLGSVHSRGVDNLNKGSDGCIDAVNSAEVACGPMELVSMEENVSIMLTDGKKRQRTVENSCVLVDANVGAGSMDVSASSAVAGVEESWLADIGC